MRMPDGAVTARVKLRWNIFHAFSPPNFTAPEFAYWYSIPETWTRKCIVTPSRAKICLHWPNPKTSRLRSSSSSTMQTTPSRARRRTISPVTRSKHLPQAFNLPRELEARRPPEARGLARDGVRLLVSDVRSRTHALTAFWDFANVLGPADLLVVNDSATIPAALDVVRSNGAAIALHLSTRISERLWIVEPRHAQLIALGERVEAPDGGAITLLAPADKAHPRLWYALLDLPYGVMPYLRRWARPIAYDYVDETFPLQAYQTIFAREPGSAVSPRRKYRRDHAALRRRESRGARNAARRTLRRSGLDGTRDRSNARSGRAHHRRRNHRRTRARVRGGPRRQRSRHARMDFAHRGRRPSAQRRRRSANRLSRAAGLPSAHARGVCRVEAHFASVCDGYRARAAVA